MARGVIPSFAERLFVWGAAWRVRKLELLRVGVLSVTLLMVTTSLVFNVLVQFGVTSDFLPRCCDRTAVRLKTILTAPVPL